MSHMLNKYKTEERKKQYFTTGTRKILLPVQMRRITERYLALISHTLMISLFKHFCNRVYIVFGVSLNTIS